MANQILDSTNEVIESLLLARAVAIEEKTNSDVLSFMGQIAFGADDLIRNAIEAIEEKKETLSFFLETSGGYVEPVQRVADTVRHHYRRIHYIVPSYAMSAGTVLVMSGDAIYMDYYSTLGPIDPQVQSQDGKAVPALGYLAKYDEMVKKAEEGRLTTAEMAFMIDKFDPATLYRYEQERELSVSMLQEWLAKYKFANWNITETSKTPVTDEMRQERAKDIGNKLSNPEIWHSHGIGIPMKRLQDELNLKIEDFGADAELNERIRQYFGLLRDYRGRMGHQWVIHTRKRHSGW